jgi:large subunit ribosomal protein L13Ae
MFRKHIVIDAKGHLVGRLASYVAKELLNGQRISIVRCEKVLVSGSRFRNNIRVMDFRHKRTSTNPKKGPIHQRSPAEMVLRKIRGMLPHKTPRGAAAYKRVKTFDGCPLSLNSKKKVVVRDALKCIRLKPRAKYCCLGDVAVTCGWTKSAVINSFEAKRVGKNKEWYLNKVKTQQAKKQKLANVADLKKVNEELAAFGY